MSMVTIKVTREEKRLIETIRENGIEPPLVYKALSQYGRDIYEDTYFDILADPENFKANEKRYEIMDRALNGYISGCITD